MYVEPWILWLILAPLGAVSAIYVGYLALLLLGLVSLSFCLGLSLGSEWLTARAGSLARPFRCYGPWFDYVAATGVLAVLVGIVALLA